MRSAAGLYGHPAQRMGRLDMRHDWLFQLVETVPQPEPVRIPVGEARELHLPVLVERLLGAA